MRESENPYSKGQLTTSLSISFGEVVGAAVAVVGCDVEVSEGRGEDTKESAVVVVVEASEGESECTDVGCCCGCCCGCC